MSITDRLPCRGFSDLEEFDPDNSIPCLFNYIQTPQYACPYKIYSRICAELGKSAIEEFMNLEKDKKERKRFEEKLKSLPEQYKKYKRNH